MTEDSASISDQQLTSVQRQVLDDACDEFEEMWRRQTWPKAEDFLGQQSEPLYSVLLEELLRIETFWRARTTDADRLRANFLERFPEKRTVVEAVLGPDESSESLFNQLNSLGPFKNLEKIGDGGFGIVYRAWDTRHQRPVALKIPRIGHALSKEELDRFLREAKAAGSLDHPNIARVWDSGSTAGVTYIAYQLIEGENLKSRFDEFTQRKPLELAGFVRQLAEAVDYAHQHGIVHRDIKPSNVLLTRDDQPVLTDFGLALGIGGEATRSLAGRIGTLDYMSPEQAAGTGEQVDERSDLWSLGVVLFELLTGQLPFEGATDIQLCSNICEAQHKRLRHLRRDVSIDLEVIVDRCLQKRPENRLASCSILVDELKRIEAGKPILSRRVSFVERSLRWCYRNPKPLLTFLVFLPITALGAWSWGLRLTEGDLKNDVIRELQLQLEVKNAQRRSLIDGLLKKRALDIRLYEQDRPYLENRLLMTVDRQERRYCAELLARNNLLRPGSYASGEIKRAALLAIVEELLEEDIDDELREELNAILNTVEP